MVFLSAACRNPNPTAPIEAIAVIQLDLGLGARFMVSQHSFSYILLKIAIHRCRVIALLIVQNNLSIRVDKRQESKPKHYLEQRQL